MPGTGWLREIYHDWEQSLLEIVRDADTPPEVKQKAEFAVQLMIDALAPTNFVLGNPAGDQEGAGDRRPVSGQRCAQLRP